MILKLEHIQQDESHVYGLLFSEGRLLTLWFRPRKNYGIRHGVPQSIYKNILLGYAPYDLWVRGKMGHIRSRDRCIIISLNTEEEIAT